MKKLLTAFAIAAFASTAMAGISGSAHDFRSHFASNDRTTQICVYCHAPHATSTVSGLLPLWNRAYTATNVYTMYSAGLRYNTTAPTGSELYTGSRVCLSCHDGSTTDVSVTVAYGDIDTAGSFGVTGVNNIGTDLQNDHPVGVTYPAALSAGYKTQPALTSLPFFAADGSQSLTGRMGCSTCHEVHNAGGFSYLLRVSSLQSAICLTCHDK